MNIHPEKGAEELRTLQLLESSDLARLKSEHYARYQKDYSTSPEPVFMGFDEEGFPQIATNGRILARR